MTEFTLHTDKLISKDKIPKNSKLISAELMDYKVKIPGEKYKPSYMKDMIQNAAILVQKIPNIKRLSRGNSRLVYH